MVIPFAGVDIIVLDEFVLVGRANVCAWLVMHTKNNGMIKRILGWYRIKKAPIYEIASGKMLS